MKFKETNLQIRCVKWFYYQYPHLRMLLFHPRNENVSGRVQGAIAKAEGVVAGVADLILLLPSESYNCLAIELKTEKGRQSASQQKFESYITAASGLYVICRSLESFKDVIKKYLENTPTQLQVALNHMNECLKQREIDEIKSLFKKKNETI